MGEGKTLYSHKIVKLVLRKAEWLVYVRDMIQIAAMQQYVKSEVSARWQ
jgi:hypothetical protein